MLTNACMNKNSSATAAHTRNHALARTHTHMHTHISQQNAHTHAAPAQGDFRATHVPAWGLMCSVVKPLRCRPFPTLLSPSSTRPSSCNQGGCITGFRVAWAEGLAELAAQKATPFGTGLRPPVPCGGRGGACGGARGGVGAASRSEKTFHGGLGQWWRACVMSLNC